MIKASASIYESAIFYRITALWVICEAFAGGIMHGLKIPFSGMMVSSLAVFCIILMAWHIPSRTAILKATLIVAIFKLMLSPHSPPTAYIAVFFQGLMGQLLVKKRTITLSAMLLGVLALVESAIQRLLVLVILYGSSFWKAVDEFIKKITGDKVISGYSFILGCTYVAIHALVGLLIGYYAARFIQQSSDWQKSNPRYLIKGFIPDTFPAETRPKKNRLKPVFIVLWLILLIIYLQSAFNPAQAILPPGKLMQIFLRSLLILLTWYMFLGPLVMLLIRNGLSKQESKNKEHIAATLQQLPETKMIFIKSWQLSKDKKGLRRLVLFVRILLVNVLGRDELMAPPIS